MQHTGVLLLIESHRSLSGTVRINLAVRLGTRKVFSFKLDWQVVSPLSLLTCLGQVPISWIIPKFYQTSSLLLQEGRMLSISTTREAFHNVQGHVEQ